MATAAVASAASAFARNTIPTLPLGLPRISALSQLEVSSRNLLSSLLLNKTKNLLVITGAGISTDSQIPDYRSPGRPAYRPLQHNEFLTSAAIRRRYWARSTIGFNRMQYATPNSAHRALVKLQMLRTSSSSSPSSSSSSSFKLITQNVDRLHQKAGSKGVLELHGTIFEIECLANCGAPIISREDFQKTLEELNGDWLKKWVKVEQEQIEETRKIGLGVLGTSTTIARPDGDVELPESAYESFRVPHCTHCGGPLLHSPSSPHTHMDTTTTTTTAASSAANPLHAVLKPRVIFHGGNVHRHVTEEAISLARDWCDAVLVLGSTVTTFSAYRLVREVSKKGGDVGIINFGDTRADDLATVKVQGHVGDILNLIVDQT